MRVCMKRLNFLILTGLILIMPFLYPAKGDGCVFYGEDSLEFLLEEDQYAMIDLEDGIQKMLVKIDIERKDVSNSTWILPIPARPDNISFNIEANMPYFLGENIEEAYQEELNDYKRGLLGFYITSIVPGLRFLYLLSSFTFTDEAGGGIDNGIEVTIHRTLDFEGIHSELVSSEDPKSLIKYLNEKGLPIQRGSLDSFDYYVDNGFSFIVSWINTNTLGGLTPALYVEFPSEQYYYPMLLTGEYEAKKIPVNLLINDWVEYADDIELSRHSEFTYYRNNIDLEYEYRKQTLEAIKRKIPETEHMEYREFMSQYGHLMTSKYLDNQTSYSRRLTLVEIDANPEEFTQDLYFDSIVPDVVEKQRKLDKIYFNDNNFPKRFLSFTILSMLSALIAGLLILRKNPDKLMMSILISLLNIIAIWVFTIATLFLLRPKETKDWYRFYGFTAAYHLIFISFSILLIEPLFIRI